jgi:hypothetical protein
LPLLGGLVAVAANTVAKRAVSFRLFGNILPLTQTQSG